MTLNGHWIRILDEGYLFFTCFFHPKHLEVGPVPFFHLWMLPWIRYGGWGWQHDSGTQVSHPQWALSTGRLAGRWAELDWIETSTGKPTWKDFYWNLNLLVSAVFYMFLPGHVEQICHMNREEYSIYYVCISFEINSLASDCRSFFFMLFIPSPITLSFRTIDLNCYLVSRIDTFLHIRFKTPFVFDSRRRSYLLPLNYPWRTVVFTPSWWAHHLIPAASCPCLVEAVEKDTLDEDGNTPGTSKNTPECVLWKKLNKWIVQLHEG